MKKSHCVVLYTHVRIYICHPGSVGGGYLFVSRVFNPLDYSYGGAAAAVVVAAVPAKGEVAAGRRGAAREVMPANRYRSLILSLLHPFGVTLTATVACCSAHVISVAGARGWPPPYGHTHRAPARLTAATVILTYTYTRHRRAHAVDDARVRDVAAALTLQPPPQTAVLRRATAALITYVYVGVWVLFVSYIHNVYIVIMRVKRVYKHIYRCT